MATVHTFSEDQESESDDEGYNQILMMLTGEDDEEYKMTFAELLYIQRVADNMGFHDECRSIRLYRLIQEALELHSSTQTLTMELLASTWLDGMECDCLHDVPESMRRELVVHCFRIIETYPRCMLIRSIYEFKVQQGHNPTTDELLEMAAARIELEHDPGAYWEKTKQQVATPNLAALPVVTTSAIEACPLCQEDIGKDTRAFQMPCCKQYYHCDAKDCLGESTVIKWLGGSRKCPGCSQEVVIHAAVASKRKREKD